MLNDKIMMLFEHILLQNHADKMDTFWQFIPAEKAFEHVKKKDKLNHSVGISL